MVRIFSAMICIFSAYYMMSVPTYAQSNYGQITLENKTNSTLDLYVDENYACRALANLNCTSQELAGERNLIARTGDDRETSTTLDLQAGGTIVWTVTEE